MLKSLKLKMEKENFKMVQKTVNLVMAVANDNGNGYAKTYCQFEDGSNNTTLLHLCMLQPSVKVSLI